MRIRNEAILTHRYSTKKGDSGTPLIIQPEREHKICYLIGIHYGKKGAGGKDENKAVRITK